MKKLLSVLLAAIMLLTLTVPAFAADNTVSLDETKSFSIDSEGSREFVFSPETSGIFEMIINLKSNQVLSVSAESGDSIVLDDYMYGYWDYDENTSFIFCATGGTKYSVYFTLEEYYEDLPMETDVEFIIKQVESKEIKTGENTVQPDECWLVFTPEKSGYYNFCSKAPENVVHELRIQHLHGYNEWFNGAEYDDGSFNFIKYFEAGESYAMRIYAYDGEYELSSEPVEFTVSYNPKIKIEYMELYGYVGDDMPEIYNDGDTLTLINGQGYSLDMYLRPDGVEYMTQISAVSGNESKLIAEYSNENQVLYINTKKVGKTTLTLAADDGTSITINIKIRSMFFAAVEAFFENLSSRICDWFAEIFIR